jgi:flagellar FliL protein
MAKDEELGDLDLGDENKSSKKLYIIVGGALGLLIAIGATLYFMGFFSSEDNSDTEKTDDEVVEETVLEPAVYFDLSGKSEQKFIVQVQSTDIRMLQVSISVMARKQEVIDVVEKHLPRLRNNILLLLASEDPEKLKMSKGKEKLRNKILKEVQQVVEEEMGEEEGVEGLYFTGFVMQ